MGRVRPRATDQAQQHPRQSESAHYVSREAKAGLGRK
jgi:hypothetical protein